MEYKQHPNESNSVLGMEWLDFPMQVTQRILEESCEVLESSPFLSHISGLSCGKHELGKIAISFLGKGSTQKLFDYDANRIVMVTCQSCLLFR
jgi:hypothetical protein